MVEKADGSPRKGTVGRTGCTVAYRSYMGSPWTLMEGRTWNIRATWSSHGPPWCIYGQLYVIKCWPYAFCMSWPPLWLELTVLTLLPTFETYRENLYIIYLLPTILFLININSYPTFQQYLCLENRDYILIWNTLLFSLKAHSTWISKVERLIKFDYLLLSSREFVLVFYWESSLTRRHYSTVKYYCEGTPNQPCVQGLFPIG